jgi:hypothetical protein
MAALASPIVKSEWRMSKEIRAIMTENMKKTGKRPRRIRITTASRNIAECIIAVRYQPWYIER